MELIISDKSGKDIFSLSDFILDMSFGDDENDFELTVKEDIPELGTSFLVYVDGKDIGGTVDKVTYDFDRFGKVVKYYGRSWQGILDHKIIEPPQGQSHLTVSGDANTILAQLINSLGLGSIFKASQDTSIPIQYTFKRYTTAYRGMVDMLMANDCTLRIQGVDGRVELACVPKKVQHLYPEQREFSLSQTMNTVNHLICLGTGELQNRTVVHLYADRQGNVSTVQSITGMDEITETYNGNNEEEPELTERGMEVLLDHQGLDSVDLDTTDETIDLNIGDYVNASEKNISIEGVVFQKLVTVEHGLTSYKYKISPTKLGGSL